jgi:hypothetical protein
MAKAMPRVLPLLLPRVRLSKPIETSATPSQPVIDSAMPRSSVETRATISGGVPRISG